MILNSVTALCMYCRLTIVQYNNSVLNTRHIDMSDMSLKRSIYIIVRVYIILTYIPKTHTKKLLKKNKNSKLIKE